MPPSNTFDQRSALFTIRVLSTTRHTLRRGRARHAVMVLAQMYGVIPCIRMCLELRVAWPLVLVGHGCCPLCLTERLLSDYSACGGRRHGTTGEAGNLRESSAAATAGGGREPTDPGDPLWADAPGGPCH